MKYIMQMKFSLIVGEELQKYVQAGYIYVPAKTSSINRGANCLDIGRNFVGAIRGLCQNTVRELLSKNLLTVTIFRYMQSEKLFTRNNKGESFCQGGSPLCYSLGL